MSNQEFEATVQQLHARHGRIFVIVSPPRCSSTAFSRVFWEHDAIGYYSHEPFEITYYEGAGLQEVASKLDAPLDLEPLTRSGSATSGSCLVIKEMPYQIGDNFPLLAALATDPIVFLIRNPKLNISSRISKKAEVGDSPIFPQVETGWELIARQVEYCRENAVPFVIVDAADFRNCPSAIFPKIFKALQLKFEERMLTWQVCPDTELDNLDGKHRHLYERVLQSTGIQPDLDPLPTLEAFPEANGFRAHILSCLDIYRELSAAPERLQLSGALPHTHHESSQADTQSS